MVHDIACDMLDCKTKTCLADIKNNVDKAELNQ